MAYSTLNAIQESIEDVILALNPGGLIRSRDKYRRVAPGFDWEDRPEVDIDRSFEFVWVTFGKPLMIGQVAEIDYEGEFNIRIGHDKTDKIKESGKRRATDLMQIKQNIEDKSNFPTGVSLIRSDSFGIPEDNETYWISDLPFSITFALVAP
jgi:hypothetical protein